MSVAPPIPARPLPLSASAPGKCIVFGEHSVVHGGPELLLAVDLTTQVLVRPSPAFSLNADPAAIESNAYFGTAVRTAWPSGVPLEVRSVSRIPRAAGLGSSAAFVAALLASLGAATGGVERAELAQRAFDVERGAQGVGSPGDTSAAVAGGYLTVNDPTGELLWEVTAGDRRWQMRRLDDPGWVWVVAHSGIPRSTADAVRAFGRRVGQPDGPDLLRRFADVAREGIEAVARGDRDRVAARMAENQSLLREAGVSHPRLEALLDAAAPAALGGKLTGAGVGGSIVALAHPGRETELVRRLARAGGLPFVVRPSVGGAALVETPPGAP